MGSTRRILGRRLPPPRATVLGAAVALTAAACGAGCAGDGPTVSIRNEDPAGKIPAMKQAAQRRDRSAVPELVKALESDDPAERLYAIEALRRITGQDWGYHYYGGDDERAAAVGRWKQWLSAQPPVPAAKAK